MLDFEKSYTISMIDDPYGYKSLYRCLVNVDGIISGISDNYCPVGGIVGDCSGSNAYGGSLITVADKLSAKTSNSSKAARVGDILGSIGGGTYFFENIFKNSSMEMDAVNTANSSYAVKEDVASPLTKSQLKQESWLKRYFCSNPYQSIDYLDEDPDAVWVIKNGELPELYYNVLRDITVSKSEHGTISVDKPQAIDDEIVTVSAEPDSGYELNKIYVNGQPIVGKTFEVNGNSDVYATFSEKTPEYNITVKGAKNASASVSNADSTAEISIMSDSDSINAMDGDEIVVTTTANENYTVDAVYVNNEAIASDSFIVSDNSVVTMDVSSISTSLTAETNEPTDVGINYAFVSGSVLSGDEQTEKYIRYWKTDEPDTVYTSEVKYGTGDYSTKLDELESFVEYSYQMTEFGDIHTFVTDYKYIDEPDSTDTPNDGGGGSSTPTPTDKPTAAPTENPKNNLFEILSAETVGNSIVANISNISSDTQSGTLIYAAYAADGTLINVEEIAINDLDPTYVFAYVFTIPENAVSGKLFIWDSYSGMRVLSESRRIE